MHRPRSSFNGSGLIVACFILALVVWVYFNG